MKREEIIDALDHVSNKLKPMKTQKSEIYADMYKCPVCSRLFPKEFYEAYSELEKEVEYVTKNTILPENPNYEKIEDFLMTSNRYSVIGSNRYSVIGAKDILKV